MSVLCYGYVTEKNIGCEVKDKNGILQTAKLANTHTRRISTMRNLKKILCLALVLSMVLAVVSGAAYTNYADDAELTVVNEDYLLAAQLLQDIGVVVGIKNYEDGKTYYAPDQQLTRGELARVLYVLYSGATDDAIYNTGTLYESLPTTFTDIDGHWAEGYIKYGQTMGYLNGKSAEIFDPDAVVLAQEMATALLLVIGYKAEDVAPNYPVNVIKYGYAADGNLFATGLSDAAAHGAAGHGLHVVGLGASMAGCVVRDTEKELPLTRELTREEAFFMMFKAITERSMVIKSKIADAYVAGVSYLPTNVEYVNYKFGVDFYRYGFENDVVAGSAKYNFGFGYAKAGQVVLEDEGAVIDFGYTVAGAAGDNVVGYGLTIAATDWDAQIGKEIDGVITSWNGKNYLTGYAIKYAEKSSALNAPKGTTVKVTKETKIAISNNGNIVINGVEYAPYCAEGYHFIVNYSDGAVKTAAELFALLEKETNTKDEIVLKVIGTKLYGVIEEQNIFAEVTADPDKDGKIAIKYVGGETDLIKADFKKGDRVFGFYNEKSKAWELTKVEPTAIVNVAVDTVDGVEKYYFENVAGTEFKVGAAFAKTEYKAFAPQFVKNETAYWALYIVDGYCLEAVKTEKVLEKDLFVIAKSVVYNTSNNTTTYTFTLNTKADGKGDAYTYTKIVNGNDAALDGIVKGDTVVYYYNAQTLVPTGIKEYQVLTVKETELLAQPVFGYVDTKVATADDVIAKLAEVTDAYIQYRIVLPAANAGNDKPVVFGSLAQKTEVEDAISAAENVAEVIIPEYEYVYETDLAASGEELIDLINNAEDGDVITLSKDIALGEDRVKIAAGKNLVIDLNGKTLSAANTTAAASCAIENKGNLTLVNGTVTYQGVGDPSFGYGTNTINNTGKLVIENATIINTTTVGSSVGIDCSAGAELIVNSGEIKSEKNAIRLCPFGSAAINCTINGGTITGARAIQIQLPSNDPASAPEINLTVNGGTLTSKVADGFALYSYSAGQSFANVDVTIAGGTFNGHVAFGGGYKGDAETVTVTGGTFNGALGRYLVGDAWEDITIS